MPSVNNPKIFTDLEIGNFESIIAARVTGTVTLSGFAGVFEGLGPVEEIRFEDASVGNGVVVRAIEEAYLGGTGNVFEVLNAQDANIEVDERAVFAELTLVHDDGANVTDKGTFTDITGGKGAGDYTLMGTGANINPGEGEDDVTVGTTAQVSEINLVDGDSDTIVFNSVVGENDLSLDPNDELFFGETQIDLSGLQPGESKTFTFGGDGTLEVTMVDPDHTVDLGTDSFDFV